jgi:hypothetical protein
MNESYAMMRYHANRKSAAIAYFLWIFGLHRAYLRRWTSWVFQGLILPGIVAFCAGLRGDTPLWEINSYAAVVGLINNYAVVVGLIAFGAVWIWKIVDLYLIPLMTRRFNNALIDHLQRKPKMSLTGYYPRDNIIVPKVKAPPTIVPNADADAPTSTAVSV